MVYINLLKFSSFIFYDHITAVNNFSSVIFHDYPYCVSTAATRVETVIQTDGAISIDVRNNVIAHKKEIKIKRK
jgi:hypothetical protein